MNETLEEKHVKQHPDKEFIGRIGREFCFLGHEFNEIGLSDVARTTKEKHTQRIRQVYEEEGASFARIGEYQQRWLV